MITRILFFLFIIVTMPFHSCPGEASDPDTFDIVINTYPAGPDDVVYIDGKQQGYAPLTARGLLSGKYMIEIKSNNKAANKEISGKSGETLKVTLKLKAAYSMNYIKGGCYSMGSRYADGLQNSSPVHEVCVNSFFIGTHEVTKGEIAEFIKDTKYKTNAELIGSCWVWDGNLNKKLSYRWDKPGFKQSENHPAVCISWNDAYRFAKWMGKKTGLAYRLPTEAEWEYAAREGGKMVKYAKFFEEDSLSLYANFCDYNCGSYWKTTLYNDGNKYTSVVGSYKPNSKGLFDMSGNVWEWCSDWYDAGYYKISSHNNPKGPSRGSVRVMRGGSWLHGIKEMRVNFRNFSRSNFRSADTGFRLARDP